MYNIISAMILFCIRMLLFIYVGMMLYIYIIFKDIASFGATFACEMGMKYFFLCLCVVAFWIGGTRGDGSEGKEKVVG